MTKQKQSLIISFLIGFAILVGLDQWTKGLAVQSLKGQKPFVIWNGVFEFYYSENRGAAFGMMQEKQLSSFSLQSLCWAQWLISYGRCRRRADTVPWLCA